MDVATLFLSSLLGTRMLPPSDLSYSELGCCHPLSFFLPLFFTRNSDVATLTRMLQPWLGCCHPLIFLSSLLGTRMSPPCDLPFFLSFFLTRNSDVATLWSVLLGTRMLPPSDLSFFLLYSELGCCHPLICLTRNSDVATLSLICLTRKSDVATSRLGTRNSALGTRNSGAPEALYSAPGKIAISKFISPKMFSRFFYIDLRFKILMTQLKHRSVNSILWR